MAAGGRLLGVRCNDPELLDVLARLLAPVRVEAADPPPTFSLRRASPARGRTPPHRLQEGCRTLVRSDALRRAATALGAFVAAFDAQDRTDRVQVGAVAVARGDAAVLVPERLRTRLGGAEDELRERGLAVADAVPAVTLDGGSVLLGAPDRCIDARALEVIDELAAEPPAPPPVAPPGRYRLAGWAWPHRSDGRAPSPAGVVTAAHRAARNRPAVGAGQALTTLATAVGSSGVASLPVGRVSTATVLAALDGLW